MTCEPMHSEQEYSLRVTEKKYFSFVGHHCRDITRSEDKCIFYPYFRVKSLLLRTSCGNVRVLGQFRESTG